MLLSDLNKIWRDREKRQIARMKDKARDEMNDMKRKLSHKAPYDYAIANKSLSYFQCKCREFSK